MCICIIIVSCVLLSLKKENFIQIPEIYSNSLLEQLAYNTSISNKKLNIIYDRYNYSKKLENLKKIKNINLTSKSSEDSLIVSDIYNFDIAKNQNKHIKLFTIIPDEKVMLFIKPVFSIINSTTSSLKELIETTYVLIGYLNDTDVNLIKILCNSMGIDKKLINLKKIESNDVTEVSCIFIYDSLNNKYLYENFTSKYKSYDYVNDVDINKIKFYLPFIKQKNIVFSDYFPERKDLTLVVSVYYIDMVLYGSNKVENNVEFTNQLNSINLDFEIYDSINYYTMYFDFFKQTMEYINLENDHIQKRDNLPILEQFVNGFYNSNTKELKPFENNINNYPFIVGDEITLDKQERDEENGVYVVDEERNLKKISTDIIDRSKTDYVCYNNPLIKQEELCQDGYWDKPCKTNNECPFYQANKNYPNYRGGCDMNGRCELPLGMKPIAFKNYDKMFKPWCYNCKSLEPECCDKQHNPDYAFSLDQFDRISNKNL